MAQPDPERDYHLSERARLANTPEATAEIEEWLRAGPDDVDELVEELHAAALAERLEREEDS